MNESVLAELRKRSFTQSSKPHLPARNFKDGYARRSHPDLIERLIEAGGVTILDAALVYHFGFATLCTLKGRVFAIAEGMRSLAFLVPSPEMIASTADDLGSNWYRVPAFAATRDEGVRTAYLEELQRLFALAHEYARDIDDRVSGSSSSCDS